MDLKYKYIFSGFKVNTFGPGHLMLHLGNLVLVT